MKWLSGIAKFFLGTMIGLSVALLTLFNVLLAWVATGPRSLETVTPYLERGLEPADHQYFISIGETLLIWDGWKHPIDIRLKDVKLMTTERRTYSKFPEISLGLNVWSLVKGQVVPTSLTIVRPVLSLLQQDDKTLRFGNLALQPESEAPEQTAPQENSTSVAIAAALAPFVAPDAASPLRKLRSLKIVDAQIRINHPRKGAIFKSLGANIILARNRSGIQAHVDAPLIYGDYQSQLRLDMVRAKADGRASGEVRVERVIPGALVDLFSEASPLRGVNVPVSGLCRFSVDAGGMIEKLEIAAQGESGTLVSEMLEGTLPLTSFSLEASVMDGGKQVTLSRLEAALEKTHLSASGKGTLDGLKSAFDLGIIASEIPAASIRKFWPPSLSPLSREWVTENITQGIVPQAQANIHIQAGDLEKPVLPKEAVDATIALEGATIHYLPEHPPVEHVQGSVHVDGKTLLATLVSGHYMQHTSFKETSVRIDDLNEDNPYIKVSLSAQTNAADAVRFLELPPLRHAQRLNLKPEKAEGSVKGSATLGFHFFSPKDEKGNATEPEVDYDVALEVEKMAHPGFMKRWDITQATGKLTVNKEKLVYTGEGNVNGANVPQAEVSYRFAPDQGFDTFIKAKGSAPVEALPRFGYPAFDFLKGTLGVDVDMKLGATREDIIATLDLTPASVQLPHLAIVKSEKEAGSLEFKAVREGAQLQVPEFRWRAKNADIHGEATLDEGMKGFRRVSMDRVKNGITDLTYALYENKPEGMVLEGRGVALDASPWLSASGEPTNFSFEHFPPMTLKLDVATLAFGEKRTLSSVKASLSCTRERCESAAASGKTVDGKPFDARIMRNPKGKRQLSLHAQNAGAFLFATNVFDSMEGGDLTIIGNYKEAAGDKPTLLRGRVDITEHTVKNAPVLAKIVSLASLTGIFDTLQGHGIAFKKLNVPFVLSRDVVTIEKAKTFGDALGMTAEGTITFPKAALDIQGAIVPSYTLNNVLGEVPLLGKILTGGDGQGVFAARYNIKGTDKAPDVSVNPLSILTPGFLRGLFDIFDKPSKKEDDEE